MPDRESFFAAIRERPEDDAPRLVYADWLDELGDTAHAELIRVQCELARVPEDNSRRSDLAAREAELLSENWDLWFGSAEVDRENLRRGFVEHLHCTPRQFRRCEDVWVRFAPSLNVSLRNDEQGYFGIDLAGLASLPVLKNWTALAIGYIYSSLTGMDFRELIQSPYLTSLRDLFLAELNIGAEGLMALAESAIPAGLRNFTLDGILSEQEITAGAGDDAVRKMIASKGAFQWQKLYLDSLLTNRGLGFLF
jgi:uncharacterized protein (TIGR02996 family)